MKIDQHHQQAIDKSRSVSGVTRILRQEGTARHGMRVHEIGKKYKKNLHKYNILTLSQLKRL